MTAAAPAHELNKITLLGRLIMEKSSKLTIG
jgi:hypothetical protein